MNVRLTRLSPVTLPPGTAAHAAPFQYCTSKEVRPYRANVIASVGSTGLGKSSWMEKTLTSLMVFGPAKSTWSQSG